MSLPPGQEHADDEALAAYALRPEASDSSLAQHIAGCEICRGHIAWMRGLLGTMQRIECPSVEQLEAYALGELGEADSLTVAAHLRRCDQCTAELAATRAFLDAAPAMIPELAAANGGTGAFSPMTSLRRIFGALAHPTPAAEGAFVVRDALDAEERSWTFIAEDIKLTLGQEADEAHRGKYVLFGKLYPNTSEQGAPAAPVPISSRLLRISDAEPVLVAEVPLERNAFQFDNVPAGSYQIEVLLPDRLIVLATITF